MDHDTLGTQHIDETSAVAVRTGIHGTNKPSFFGSNIHKSVKVFGVQLCTLWGRLRKLGREKQKRALQRQWQHSMIVNLDGLGQGFWGTNLAGNAGSTYTTQSYLTNW
jgi:hypothetical protein